MATSGSINFSQTRSQLIEDAFADLGIYGIGRTVSDEDMQFASNKLNKMIKAWSTKGLHLWCKEEAVLYVQPDTATYLLGSTAKATKASDEVITSLNGDHAAGSLTLTLDSTSGMTVADAVGVVLSDKTIYWTTISTIPGATSITIPASGLSGAADDNALVYTYTSALAKPLRILDARRRTGIDDTIIDLPISEIAYQDYQNFPVKSPGTSPTQFNYKPGTTYGSLYLWPCPSDGAERVHFTYERVIEDLDAHSDDFDFPQEWLEALEYQLAVRLARPFGKAAALQDLLPMASTMLDDLLNWDAEKSPVQMEPQL